MSTQIPPETRLAILHQAAPPPPVNGIHKPMKPGGYQDSGADIAFCLSQSHSSNIKVITPLLSPKPEQAEGWTFPDTESGILTALNQGATHIWANTILFSTHPLQISPLLDPCLDNVKVVGQPPNLVEMGDDKEFVNNLLRAHDGFTLPKSWSLSLGEEVEIEKLGLTYPVVAKPIRGRGSFGVKVCHSEAELQSHLRSLLADSSRVMIEEFLSGQEATLTVMPPSHSKPDYYALPPVKRFNHQNDIAPWNGIVAVSANSCVVTNEEMERDARWGEVMRECERAAQLLGVVGVIRIDVRRFGGKGERSDKFALFDVNMKPNMTGPGRPGRDDQTSLCGIAADGLGWGFEKLLTEMLNSAKTLGEVRRIKPSTK